MSQKIDLKGQCISVGEVKTDSKGKAYLSVILLSGDREYHIKINDGKSPVERGKEIELKNVYVGEWNGNATYSWYPPKPYGNSGKGNFQTNYRVKALEFASALYAGTKDFSKAIDCAELFLMWMEKAPVQKPAEAKPAQPKNDVSYGGNAAGEEENETEIPF